MGLLALIFLWGGGLLGAYTNIEGISNSTLRKRIVLWILTLAMLICGTILAVHQQHENDQRYSNQREAIASVDSELRKTRESLAAAQADIRKLVPPWSGVEGMKKLSDEQLRSEVSAVAIRMRSFERDYYAANQRISTDHQNQMRELFMYGSTTQQQKNAAQQAYGEALDKTIAKWTADYRAQLLPEVLAVREELEWRLRIKNPNPGRAAVALDPESPSLAGVAPLSQGAAYLEQLARQLPP